MAASIQAEVGPRPVFLVKYTTTLAEGSQFDSSSMPFQGRPTKVLLFGAGSIGAVYLYQLQQAGCEVTAVCRSNYAFDK